MAFILFLCLWAKLGQNLEILSSDDNLIIMDIIGQLAIALASLSGTLKKGVGQKDSSVEPFLL